MTMGKIYVPPRSWQQTGVAYKNVPAQLKAGTGISASFRTVGGASTKTETFSAASLKADVTPGFAEQIINNSLRFELGGKTYVSRDGQLFADINPLTGAGVSAGTLNSSTGEATLTLWNSGQPAAVALKSLLTTMTGRGVGDITFRVPIAPVKPGSVQLLATRLDGTAINATVDSSGDYKGAGITMHANAETGVVWVRFGSWVTAAGKENEPWYHADNVDGTKVFKPEPVLADSIRFNAVAYKAIPLNADQIGINPVRLPQNGKVRWIRAGDAAVVGRKWKTTATVSNNQSVALGHAVSRAYVMLKNSHTPVPAAAYTVDFEAGTVLFNNITANTEVDVWAAYEVLAQVTAVDISGRVTLNRSIPAGESFTANQAYLATVINHGTRFARVSHKFEQKTWTGNWQDSIDGDAPLAKYNAVQHPIAVTNAGALSERWLIRFLSSTRFQCIGQKVGVLGEGEITSDYAPQNPAAPQQQPYFTISAAGWGAGWGAGECVRFNTVGALNALAVIQCINPGEPTAIDHRFEMVVGCNVDRPAP